MSFTFVSESPAGPIMRRLSLTGLCRLQNVRVVDVPGGAEVRAEMANRPGEWKFASPGGLCTVFSRDYFAQLGQRLAP